MQGRMNRCSTIILLHSKQLENDEELIKVSNELLALNPDNTDALFFLGKHFFWKAENRYQSEMEAYEKNRTNRQYAQLLRAFETLNADFRKSLDYFLRLYKINPQPRYARFIGNIYLRFEDKGKADFYHKKADQ
jgi:tetratricopeptide (TPR) repeat protein